MAYSLLRILDAEGSKVGTRTVENGSEINRHSRASAIAMDSRKSSCANRGPRQWLSYRGGGEIGSEVASYTKGDSRFDRLAHAAYTPGQSRLGDFDMLFIHNDVVQQVLTIEDAIRSQEEAFLGLITRDSVHRTRIDIYVPASGKMATSAGERWRAPARRWVSMRSE